MAPPPLQHARHYHFSFRGLITYLVALSFLMMLISGIAGFLAPSGRIARQVGWTLMGLDRAGWQTLHLSFAVIFVAVGVVHLIYNWKGLLHYMRNRVTHHLALKREAVLAFAITFWLIASAVLALPPASTLHDFSTYFRQTFWVVERSLEGTNVAPATVEPTGQLPPISAATLPQGHPPIPRDKPCSVCHQGK